MTTMTSHRDIDKGWAWLVLFASYFNLLVCSGIAYVAGMFQLLFLQQFQGSVAFTSWVTALFSSLMQLAGPLSSLIANWVSCRASVMLGGVLLAIGLFASSLANSLEMLFVTFGVLSGVGLGLTYTASIIVVNYFFVERRTFVTGFAFSASGLGIVIAPQVSQYLFSNFTWRESLAIMGAASAQICVLGALMSSVHERKAKQSCCPCASGHRGTASLDQDFEFHDHDDEENEGGGGGEVVNQLSSVAHTHHITVTDTSSLQLRESNVSQGQRVNVQEPKSEFKLKSSPPAPKPSVFSSHDDLSKKCTSKLSPFGSHQELTPKQSPQIRALLQSGVHTRSDQELSNRLLHKHVTSSNPSLLRHLHKAGDSRQRLNGASRSSIDKRDTDFHQHIVIVSRNPSLLGLVPSTAPLDIVVTPGHLLQSNSSLNSNSIFENTVILTQLSPLEQTVMPGERFEDKGDNALKHDNSSLVHESSKFPPLYRNKYFWLLCLSLFVGNAGCGIFNIHFTGFVKDRGLTDRELTDILSVNGFALLFGRCLCAALANAAKGNDLLIYWALHVIGGLCVCLMPVLGYSFTSLAVLMYCVGSNCGTVYAVLSPITIDIVGLAGLATAFGIEMVCAGLGYFISPPLAGLLIDITNTYEYSMYCGGALFILGGMITFSLPLLGYRQSHVFADEGQGSPVDDNETSSVEGCGLTDDDR